MSEQPATPKRPWTVTTAYYMLWLWLLSIPGFIAIFIWWNLPEGAISKLSPECGNVDTLVSALVVAFLLFWLPLTIVLYEVGKGRNWARIVFLIVLLLGAPFTVQRIIGLSGDSFFPGQLCQIFQLEVLIVAVVLLFQRSSSDWFKTVKQLSGKDQQPSAS